MLTHDAYQTYHAVDLDARTARASPVQLVLVLTDGLLEELARARAHIVARRYEHKARALDKCVQIINGLASALDFDQGGAVVANLARLYDYCAGRLYRAGIDLDPLLVDEVSALLTTIRQGWVGVQARHG
jgi:flagellar protein FliS